MKGIVFVKLVEMAEVILGEAVMDEIIESCDLPSGGAYTIVGNYPCAEMMTLVQAISAHTGAAEAQLQRLFGGWMHNHFVESYPNFFRDKPDALTMLAAIEGEVHVEVRKLYPEAELPQFDILTHSEGSLRMVYRSPRPLSDFCHGLVEACVEHFGRPADIVRQDMSDSVNAITEFQITYRD